MGKNTKRTIKRSMAIASMLCLAFPMMACHFTGETPSLPSEIGELAEVWSCHSTINVLQDKDIYDDVKGLPEIELTVAKGEYEASQIIISALQDISSYDFITADLTSASGDTISTEQVDIFHEKYIKVSTNYNGSITGMYPDAIVPLENIKNVGENTVAIGDNQGIYVRFNIPLNQPTGVYTGTFTLEIEDEEQTIPVRLNVLDIEVSEVNHVKSAYETKYGYFYGEQDGSQDMLDKYSEFLYEYRLCNSTIVPPEGAHRDSDIAHFVEVAYKHMQNPKCSFVCIPYRCNNLELDGGILEKYLRAMAEKSFETGFDMLAKAGGYVGSIDEPEGSRPDSLVQQVSTTWTNTCVSVAESIANDDSITSPIKDQVVESMKACYNVVTTGNTERYKSLGVTTFCPGYQTYDTAEKRAEFADQERWWYGCIYPRAPYVNNQIDNELRSPLRVLGWMQADYDVVGNLFWAVDGYTRYEPYDGNTSNKVNLEDCYDTATRWPSTNGDGFLTYPGAPYGIDGPVGTLRLEAMRDGFEEQELLMALKEKYNETGAALGENAFTAEALFESLSVSLYSGAIVTADTDDMIAARNALFALYALNQSSSEFYIVDYEDNGMGTKTYTVYTAKGTTVKNNGVEVTTKQELANGILWTIACDLSQEVNALDLEVTNGGVTNTYYVALGGMSIMKTPKDISLSDITSSLAISTSFLDNDAHSGTSIKIEMPKVDPDVEQTIRLQGGILSDIDANATKVNLKFNWRAEGTDPEVIISAKFSKSAVLVDIGSSPAFHWGVNIIEMNVSNLNWSKLGELEYIQIRFGGVGGENARTVYLAGITVYKK